MYHEDETELTLEERNALASLQRELPVSDILEARVVRSLKNDGHLGAAPSRTNRIPLALKIAAAIALFAGGVATGRYILAGETAQSASISTPPAGLRDIPTSRPPTTQPASRSGESVVAEREVWF